MAQNREKLLKIVEKFKKSSKMLKIRRKSLKSSKMAKIVENGAKSWKITKNSRKILKIVEISLKYVENR